MNPLLVLQLIIVVPFLLLPLVVGITLLLTYPTTAEIQFVGCLTLKPVLVIPLALIIIMWLYDHITNSYGGLLMLVAVLPDIITSISLIWLYAPLVTKRYRGGVVGVLVLDAIRWISHLYTVYVGWRTAEVASTIGTFMLALVPIIALVLRAIILHQNSAGAVAHIHRVLSQRDD